MADGMSATELEEALAHDAARRDANGGDEEAATEGQDAGVTQQLVSAALLLDNLELKQAALATSVSLSYTDVAQACAGLILIQLRPSVDLTGEARKPPQPDLVLITSYLDVAEQALKLARESDVLGDKPAVRMMETAEPVPAE